MSVRPCPNCLYPAARYLEGPSADAHVRYYRCEPCGHVFVVPNENPDGPPRTIAPGKKPPNGRPLALPVSAPAGSRAVAARAGVVRSYRINPLTPRLRLWVS